MKRIFKVTVWAAVSLAALYPLLAVTVGVSFYRAVPLDNDPLTNSIAVTGIHSNRLTLVDGRVLLMRGYEPKQLSQDILDSDSQIELDTDDSRFAGIYVKKKRFICGTHAAAIVIPIRHREYPAYHRRLLGLGEFQ
jgi:hypothetical protein